MRNLKSFILASACAAAMAMPAMADEAAEASVTPASANLVYASFTGGWLSADFDGFDGDVFYGFLSGGFRISESGWNMQADLGQDSTSLDVGPELDNFSIGLSLFMRDSNAHALGAAVERQAITSNVFSSAHWLNYGVFGEYYSGDFTVGGALFLIDGDLIEGWGGQIDGSWYICDNAALRGKFRWNDVDGAPDTSTVFGLSAEYQFSYFAPLVFGVDYEHVEGFSSNSSDLLGVHFTWRVGGSSSDVMMDRDRNGTIDTRMTTSVREIF
ncbi:MAG TPA: hypothetical protein PLA85_12175 [Micropepsaceae bacterium]|nr:hypothetical protein [Micropepsaceae bacterium]